MRIIDLIMSFEGGLVDNPNDSGGITNHGISYKFYKSIKKDAKKSDIINLTKAKAKSIYHKHFYLKSKCNLIDSKKFAYVFLDQCINTGIHSASKRLFNVLKNDLNKALLLELEFPISNIIKLMNFEIFDCKMKEKLFIYSYLLESANHYLELANRNRRLRVFLRGWLNRVMHLRLSLKTFSKSE